MRFVPISQITLTGGPLHRAQEADRAYLHALDPDRLLAPILREAGLAPRAPSYDGWEARGLDGHTAGHYLSAAALMVASTGDTILHERLDYTVSELARAQDHLGTGFVGGVPRSAELWDEVAAGITDTTFRDGRWVPWYNLHKLYAGLIEAVRSTGSVQAKSVLLRLADWWEQVAAGIDDDRFQLMLETEIGGMNEAYVDLFDLTGEPRHLDMARRFTGVALMEPLSRRSDELTGLHANTRIPQFVGFAALAARSNDHELDEAARFAWETILTRRSVAIGGNSVREHFHELDDFTPMTEDREGPETCNSYNLIKLGRRLVEQGDDPQIMDAIERVLFNHILSAQHPGHGGLVYFTSMRPDHYRVYSSPQHSFWCCVGTGMESHAKHGESLYAADEHTVSVELFAPSVVQLPELGLVLRQATRFPDDGAVTLAFGLQEPRRLRVRIRVPAWSEGLAAVRVNGETVATTTEVGHVTVDRAWADGDTMAFELQMSGRLDVLPDGSDWAAVCWGPSVLALRGDELDAETTLAARPHANHTATGALVSLASAPILERGAVPGRSADGAFFIDSDRGPLQLERFAELHDARYTVTFPIVHSTDPEELSSRRGRLIARDRLAATLEGRTIDRVALGEQQPEIDHGFRGTATTNGATGPTQWRSTTERMSVILIDPHLLGAVVRVTWHSHTGTTVPDPAFLLEIDGSPVEGDRHGDGDGLSWTEFHLAPTDSGWGRRRFDIVAPVGRATARIAEVRILSAVGPD
ncbi:MAG TPA: beta-L-arabinofuranosidase domain-containing protein [Plantibacter sp.]|uniref:beta-L-arabinofuranosidase domain-containing protein n=1 Tax=unclassified Plantibacter TaxID=2624265 RepID=UPI002B69BAEA|nr:beta-L-arabinofuranosidase domain-containing protein [Plantibacter sp.]